NRSIRDTGNFCAFLQGLTKHVTNVPGQNDPLRSGPEPRDLRVSDSAGGLSPPVAAVLVAPRRHRCSEVALAVHRRSPVATRHALPPLPMPSLHYASLES